MEGFDGALGDGEGWVGDGFFEVEADDAAEAAAFRAGTERGVEGEEGGGGGAEGEAGVRGWSRWWRTDVKIERWIGGCQLDGGVAFAEVEGGFEGFEEAGVVFGC